MLLFNKRLVIESGFSMIEVLFSIAIVVAVATFTLVGFKGIRVKSLNTFRLSDVNQIRDILALYRADNGMYPSTLTPGQPLVGPNGKTYVGQVPANRADELCPNPYSYQAVNNGLDYNLDWCLSTKLEQYAQGNCTASQSDLCCLPSCDGKQCGDNGCGGSCGTCSGTGSCSNNQCVFNPTLTAFQDVAGDNTWYNPVVSSNGLVMAVTGIASVQVSEDGGVTWANRPIGPDQYSDITDLTMSDSGDLMLVLIGNKIYLSTDKGITWTNKVVFSDNPIDGEMSSNGQVMAVVSTHGSVAYSTDFGQTWVWSSTSAVPVGYVVLDFSCNRNDCSKWVVTRSGSASVVKSINHGSTWTNSAATPITIYKLGAVAISDDGQVILVHNNDSSSYDKLLRSANFGSLPWTVYSAANFNDIRADGIVIKGSRVSYISGSSRLVTSGDLGITWSGSSLASGYLWSDINLASSSSNVYLGTTVNESFNNKFGYIHTSSDSGSTFVIRKPNYIDRSFNNLQGSLTIAPNAAAAWAFPSGPMRRSINRGQIWESNYVINVYYVGSAWSINRIISSNQNLWKLECAGTSCNLNKFSFDAGGSVSAQQLVSSSAGQIRTDIAVDASGQKVINTLGGASQVNYSFDGGTSWQAMTIDDFMLSSSYYFGAVAISQNGNHLAVCVLSNDNDKLLLNSGNFNNISDWRVKSLPTGYRCLDHGTLAISNSGQIIALANTYVGVSKDGGQTWTRDNLSNGGGSYRRLVCDQNCTVIMAVKEKVIKSHVVKSVNGGDTWQLDQDLGEEYWSDIAISGDGSLIIAAPRYGQLRVAN